MKKLLYLLQLTRPWQWYKNLLIFLAIIFSGNLFNILLLSQTLIGFLALCAISSANYIINDLFDIEHDRNNPEKKHRPLAANKVLKYEAISIAILLIAISIALALLLNTKFLAIIITLFLLTKLYSFKLKNIIFLDVILISINFLLRAIAGAVIIDVYISPWLISGIFFFAFFISVGKRYSELSYSKKNIRKVLEKYDQKTLNSMLMISTTLLLICYSLFAFTHKYLIWTMPLFLFLILRYHHLIKEGSYLARHPENIYKDTQILIGSIIFILATLIILYF